MDAETVQGIGILFGVAGTAFIFLSRKFTSTLAARVMIIMGLILVIQSGLLFFLGPKYF